MAKRHSKKVPQVALNWILSQNVFPILGAKKLEQIKDNMGAVGWTLSDEELREIDEVSRPEERYPYRFISWANGKGGF